MSLEANEEVAYLAGGCFWCVEAVYKRITGIIQLESGYMGGHIDHPSYQMVCTGETGHAEAVKLTYDAKILSYKEVLEYFFIMHDPTTLNRQGNDVGTQYRSAIFYQTAAQKQTAMEVIKELQPEFSGKIVTTLEPFKKFYLAEEKHQDYYDRNRYQPYCMAVISPKLKKLKLAGSN